MLDILINKIIPINLIFLLGYSLKKFKILNESDGKVFLKSMFFAFMPALLFQSIRRTEFKIELLAYPSLIIIYQLLVFIIGKLIVKEFKIPKDKETIVRASLLIINSGFLIPFYIAFNGTGNMWRLGLYDFGNSLFTFVVVYSMFLDIKIKESLKLLKSPPIISMCLGILFGLLNLKLPLFIDSFLTTIGSLAGISVMLGLGLYFSPSFKNIKITLPIVLIKMILGLVVGLALLNHLPFDDLSNKTLVYMLASPVGANILTFSVLGRMDTKFSAEIVSLSILINLIVIPVLFIFLNS